MDSFGLSQTYVNNKLIHDLKWDANYNGKTLDVGVSQNHKGESDNYFIQLTNNDIINLLSIPANKQSLDSRLNKELKMLLPKPSNKSRKHRASKSKSRRHRHRHRRSKHKKKHHSHTRKRKSILDIDKVIY